MKKDITDRTDIELLVRSFYAKVTADTLIGPIFTDIAKVDWEKHLPVMFDFWENTLFQTSGYSGNPMKTHSKLNQLFPLTGQHFERWLLLFTSTVNDLFDGDTAELAKQRALSISTIMRIKLAEAQ